MYRLCCLDGLLSPSLCFLSAAACNIGLLGESLFLKGVSSAIFAKEQQNKEHRLFCLEGLRSFQCIPARKAGGYIGFVVGKPVLQ